MPKLFGEVWTHGITLTCWRRGGPPSSDGGAVFRACQTSSRLNSNVDAEWSRDHFAHRLLLTSICSLDGFWCVFHPRQTLQRLQLCLVRTCLCGVLFQLDFISFIFAMSKCSEGKINVPKRSGVGIGVCVIYARRNKKGDCLCCVGFTLKII